MLLAGALSVVYLAYRPFPEWWYLRFLLPAVALSLVLASVAIVRARRAPAAGGAVPLALVADRRRRRCGGCAAAKAATRSACGSSRRASRSRRRPWPAHLPADTVAITVWQSGGLRFWPGREVVVWDALDPGVARPRRGVADRPRPPPAIVVERWEEEGFRQRFAGQAYGALDWPPRYDVDRRVRIFLPEDRARYLAGEPVVTTPVFAPRR